MVHVDQAGRFGLAEYFRQQLTAESAEHPNEETRWYLGNLLERFSSNDALFSYEEGELCIRPLALLYDDARQHPHERERCLLLRQLGDQALFLGGAVSGALCPQGDSAGLLHRHGDRCL